MFVWRRSASTNQLWRKNVFSGGKVVFFRLSVVLFLPPLILRSFLPEKRSGQSIFIYPSLVKRLSFSEGDGFPHCAVFPVPVPFLQTHKRAASAAGERPPHVPGFCSRERTNIFPPAAGHGCSEKKVKQVACLSTDVYNQLEEIKNVLGLVFRKEECHS